MPISTFCLLNGRKQVSAISIIRFFAAIERLPIYSELHLREKKSSALLLGRHEFAAFLASYSSGKDERRGWLLLPVVLSATQWRPAASVHYAAQCFPASSSRTHVHALKRYLAA